MHILYESEEPKQAVIHVTDTLLVGMASRLE